MKNFTQSVIVEFVISDIAGKEHILLGTIDNNFLSYLRPSDKMLTPKGNTSDPNLPIRSSGDDQCRLRLRADYYSTAYESRMTGII